MRMTPGRQGLGTTGGPDSDVEPKSVECLLLAVAHHWSLRETHERQVELLSRFFDQEQMKTALTKLESVVTTMEKHKNRQNGALKTATKAQAEDVAEAIKSLGDSNTLPRLTIQSDDLQRIAPLLNAVSIGDERGVAARLEALELAMKTNQAEMMRFVTATRHFQVPAQPTLPPVRPPVAQGHDQSKDQSQDQSYANVAGGGRRGRVIQGQEPRSAGGQAGAGGQTSSAFLEPRPQRQRRKVSQGGGEERSASAKRQRSGSDGEWQVVAPPPPRGAKKRQEWGPTLTGTATGGTAAKFQRGVEIYVGNTPGYVTADDVRDTLYERANTQPFAGEFQIDDVVTLNKHPNPQTRSWKLRVPKRCESEALNPDNYPEGWRIRKFDIQGSKRGATGQEIPVPRKGHQSPPKTVVTEAPVGATVEEPSVESNPSEEMESTDVEA